MTEPAPDAPTLLLVESDAEASARVGQVLAARYGADYRLRTASSVAQMRTVCDEVGAAGGRMALAIVGVDVVAAEGFEVFAQVRSRCPEARCLLAGAWTGEGMDTTALVEAYARGAFDDYVPYPLVRPDEGFHATVTELLAWHAREHGPRFELVRIVGDPWSSRAHEVRDLMTRNLVPYGFYEVGSDAGRALLEEAGVDADRGPVLLLPDGRALVDPSMTDAARALGTEQPLSSTAFDVTIVGAGPAGLAAAVYASSEGLRTLVVEAEAVGGQAGTTSMIRNYLGFPQGISGAELARRSGLQAQRLGARFQVLVGADAIHPGPYEHRVTLSSGTEVTSGAVVIATGVAYRRLDTPGVARLSGAGVYYGPALSEAPRLAGEVVYVVGGGNSAGQAAVHLARHARQVTLLVRGRSLAASMSDYLVQELHLAPNVELRFETEVASAEGEHRLETLVLRERGGRSYRVPAAALFVLIGGRPRTAWLDGRVALDEGGYVLTGADVPPADADGPRRPFETSAPGVFAVGDVRHGSIKRVASATGEGSVCVAYVHERLASIPRVAGARGD